jgi:hypothetical protein
MKLKLVLTAVAVLAATLLPTVASAHPDADRGKFPSRGKFLSLPPDLSTRYLEGHYPHRDPLHPDADYRHRRLATADEHGVERFNGEVERIPANELCGFPVELRQWGTRPFWVWLEGGGGEEPRPVHVVENPKLVSRFSANGRSFWSIDEGWDYVWFNDDGTVFIEGTGTHFWVHDKHRKFRMYGTWHLLEGEQGLLYSKLFRDKTSVWDGPIQQIERKICQFLMPR